MESLILENFRCFAGRHKVPLRPLTLLVGENSSGKTSLLAAARIAELLRTRVDNVPDFNEDPFFLGGFDDLVNKKTARNGRSDSLGIGATYLGRDRKELPPFQFLASFANSGGRPGIKRVSLAQAGFQIIFSPKVDKPSFWVETPKKPEGFDPLVKFPMREGAGHDASNWGEFAAYFKYVLFLLPDQIGLHVKLDATETRALREITDFWLGKDKLPPFAFAPIRAQPKRTYESLSDLPRPQGDHVPMLLAQIYGQKEWDALCGPVEKFGRASDLFDEIIVKHLGRSESSPIQIHVKLGGPSRNIMDVGYGVSQALPLLVDLMRDKRPRMYLVQQPEVHLHPRAQAELGTLFAMIAKNHVKQLLIETHSDYIVDRIRMEVREKTIKPADMIILFFERVRGEVKIHPIEVDELGNLIDPPASFGSFFLDEQARFLGVADVHHH